VTRTLLALSALSLLPLSYATTVFAVRRLVIQVAAGGRGVEVFRAVPVYRGLPHQLAVTGTGVEKVTRVVGSRGLLVPESGLRRSMDALQLGIQVDPGAPLGPADLRLHFANEAPGPEVIPVVVLRNGRVTSVEPRKVAPGQRVILTFTGLEIGNAEVLAQNAYIGARVLPSGSETRCQVELTFTRPGTFEVPLYDQAGLPRPGATLDAPGGYLRAAAAAVEVAAR